MGLNELKEIIVVVGLVATTWKKIKEALRWQPKRPPDNKDN